MNTVRNGSVGGRRWRWMGVALGMMALCTNASGKPMNWGENIPSQKWPNDKKITIFIPENTEAGHANDNDDVKTGIERWTTKMSSPYGLSFNIHLRSPQGGDPTTNRVIVSWPADGTLPDGNDGRGTATADGTNITSGTIEIERDSTGRDFLKNLGMHEFGHILGLDDDATSGSDPHNVMDHNVDADGAMTFSARDNKEIKSLYGSGTSKENAQGGVESSSQSIPGDLWEYQYDVFWDPTGPDVEIPILEIWIGSHPETVQVAVMPSGWAVDYPPEILDGVPVPTPTPDTRKLHFYAVHPEAPFDMYNPMGTFVILSPFPPGPGTAHAMIQGEGGQPWTIFNVDVPRDSAIPSVSEWGLIVMVLIGLTAGGILFGRRHRRRSAAE